MTEIERITAERDAAKATAERLAARVEQLKGALRACRRQMQNEWHNKPRIGMEAECAQADAALTAPDDAQAMLAKRDERVRREKHLWTTAEYRKALADEDSYTDTTDLAAIEEHDARVAAEATAPLIQHCAMLRAALDELRGLAEGVRDYGEKFDSFSLQPAVRALAATPADVRAYVEGIRAVARRAAFRSIALEIRASIACAECDNDPIDTSWAEACAEQCEAYADGDGEPDDERMHRLLTATTSPTENKR